MLDEIVPHNISKINRIIERFGMNISLAEMSKVTVNLTVMFYGHVNPWVFLKGALSDLDSNIFHDRKVTQTRKISNGY